MSKQSDAGDKKVEKQQPASEKPAIKMEDIGAVEDVGNLFKHMMRGDSLPKDESSKMSGGKPAGRDACLAIGTGLTEALHDREQEITTKGKGPGRQGTEQGPVEVLGKAGAGEGKGQQRGEQRIGNKSEQEVIDKGHGPGRQGTEHGPAEVLGKAGAGEGKGQQRGEQRIGNKSEQEVIDKGHGPGRQGTEREPAEKIPGKEETKGSDRQSDNSDLADSLTVHQTDDKGRPTVVTDANGNPAFITYNDRGEVARYQCRDTDGVFRTYTRRGAGSNEWDVNPPVNGQSHFRANIKITKAGTEAQVEVEIQTPDGQKVTVIKR